VAAEESEQPLAGAGQRREPGRPVGAADERRPQVQQLVGHETSSGPAALAHPPTIRQARLRKVATGSTVWSPKCSVGSSPTRPTATASSSASRESFMCSSGERSTSAPEPPTPTSPRPARRRHRHRTSPTRPSHSHRRRPRADQWPPRPVPLPVRPVRPVAAQPGVVQLPADPEIAAGHRDVAGDLLDVTQHRQPAAHLSIK
jgi:hypothetical protein